MAKKSPPAVPPIAAIYGDEPHQKSTALTCLLDELLPPNVDRDLALTAYDGERPPEQGGPEISTVLNDLRTLPFLAERRVVVIRDADGFITRHREALERYAAAPARTGVLVLECRSFPKNTKLFKAVAAVGGLAQECRKLYGRALLEFVQDEARKRGARMSEGVAARLVELIGTDSGALAAEVDKLALYVSPRQEITDVDLSALVGETREEKIFAVADAAGAGRLQDALRMWNQVIETDSEAPFRAVGGLAFVLRRWLNAHRSVAEGATPFELARKMMMFDRPQELQVILRRQSPARLRRALAALADLDSQAKSGARSIEKGVELLLVRLAGA